MITSTSRHSSRAPDSPDAMSDPNAVKILIAGDVRGNLASLYKRVEAVNASSAGPFAALFCVGRFFGSAAAAAGDGEDGADATPTASDPNADIRAYVDGTLTAPLPTYFIDGLPHGREFCRHPEGVVAPNITFLRRAKVYEIHGLRVAALPGRHNPLAHDDESQLAATTAERLGEYRAADVRSLRQSNASTGIDPGGVVDLLLTSEWPRGCDAFAATAPGHAVASAAAAGSPVVADVARDTQPRYHACGAGDTAGGDTAGGDTAGGCHYAREPYKNPRGHATRLVALASVGNDRKERWLHALALLPASRQPPSALQQLPPDTTRSPYDARGGANGGSTDAAGGDAANFAGVRWEEPRAKRARVASQVRTEPLKGDPDKTVYVRNLAFRADEGALAEFFAQCGEIADLRLGRDAESGRSRGFCHVAYSTAEAAEKALALHETTFYGRDIVVQMAKTEEERNADRDRRREEKRGRPPPPPPGGCWFCLSNEKDTHLVASIATESFIAMDKGGVVPDHCQVVPVEHTPSFAALSPSAADEIWRYLGAVRACLRAGGGGAPVPENAASPLDTVGVPGEMGGPRELVAFERHLALRSKGGNHMHLNCVPVPADRARKARKIFEQAAKRLGFEWEVVEAPESALDLQTAIASHCGDGEYYAVHLPDGTVLLRKIGRGEPHWMSFGREVLGHLLGCPERTSWQNCMETEEKETERANAFKASFEAFDIMQG